MDNITFDKGELNMPHPKFEICHASIAGAKPYKHGSHTLHVCSADSDIGHRHFTEPEPIVCKWCGSKDIMKYGISEGGQEYICKVCKRKFTNRDMPFGKRSTAENIGTSISSYYDGLSFADIARHLSESGNPVNESTVYRWVISYTEKAVKMMESYKPKVGGIWIADETAIKFNGELYWLWDLIDKNTRFLLASYLSEKRGTYQAQRLMELAAKRAGRIPKTVITDKLAAYLDGIEVPFGSDTDHIQSSPFAAQDDTNVIERFQGTIKDRTKVIRGFKTLETAIIILDGFLVHYNFFKPHLSLGKTPAEQAGLKIPFKTWTEFVRGDK
ncbi:MAG: IS6 family transposase [Dehalococcoidia bacterium]|nr:MAG: IS6 family transposase [Dehalococcoidia bacterium]